MTIQAAKIRVDFEADTSGVTRQLAEFQGQVTNTTGRMRGAFQGLGPVLTGALGGFIGMLAVPAITGFAENIVSTGVELGKLGVQLQQTEEAFSEVARSSGQSGTTILEGLRKASGGAIADSSLVQTAMEAMSLGVTTSLEDMVSLMDLAADRGQRMNVDLTTSFSKVVEAIGKANPESLESLGIIVDSTQVYRAYAQQLGVTTSQLTELQKRQALLNEALTQASGLKPASETVSEIEKATIAVQNFREELAKLLAPGIEKAAEVGLGVVEAAQATFAPETTAFADKMLAAYQKGYDERLKILEEYRAQLVPIQRDIAKIEAGDYSGIDQPIEELQHQQAALLALIQATDQGLADASQGMQTYSAAVAQNARIQSEANVAWTEAGAAAEKYAETIARVQSEIAERSAAFEQIDKLAGKMADVLLPDLGPQVFGMIDEWGARWQAQFDILVQNGYTAEQALKIVTVEAQKMGQSLSEAANNGALPTITRDAIIAQGGLAGAALAAEALARAVQKVKGVWEGGDLGLEGFDPFSEFRGKKGRAGKAPGSLGVHMSDPFEKLVDRVTKTTSGLGDANKALQSFTSSLQSVPGLFGKSEVTQEQLDLAALGIPQEFADDFLRQAKDEFVGNLKDGMMVKTDWPDVDPKDVAERLGLDPNLPSEVLYAALEKAWEDHSLFADPKNLELFNMDAVQKAVEDMEKSAQGEANIKALFGIGDEATIATVAALGLDIQSGLTQWVEEHGAPEAAAALSSALGDGLVEGGESTGGGVVSGLFNWIDSSEGKDSLAKAGERLAKEISKNLKVIPTVEIPTSGGPNDRNGNPTVDPPPGGLGGRAKQTSTGPKQASTTGVVIQASVRADHDVQILARQVARIIQRGSA